MLNKIFSLLHNDDADDDVKINWNPSEPVLSLPADESDRLIDRWLADCNERLSADTVSGYRFKVGYFRDWWHSDGRRYNWQLSRRSLRQFERWLRTQSSRFDGQPLSYHTRNDALRRLSAMLTWAFNENYTPANCAAWVPAAEGAPPEREAASIDMLQQLLEAAGESPAPNRDAAIVALLIGTGMRIGECAKLRIEDIQFNADGSGIAVVYGKRSLASRDSGRREVAFDRITGGYLTNYLDALRLYTDIKTGAAWRSLRGLAPLTQQGVHKAVKRAIKNAGLDGQIKGAHDLRRAFATHWARLIITEFGEIPGPMADLLRRQLGHKSYAVTAERYALLTSEDIRANIRSPLAFMSHDDAEDDA